LRERFLSRTLFKDSEHASYIWTAIATAIHAEAEELETQRKWANGEYGNNKTGAAYYAWVRATVDIHIKYGLTGTVLLVLQKLHLFQ
jgi:hypothetical protein